MVEAVASTVITPPKPLFEELKKRAEEHGLSVEEYLADRKDAEEAFSRVGRLVRTIAQKLGAA
jgi:ABC-type uncharacterized transport system substrate-binding protein